MFNCRETRLKNRIKFSVILLHEQNTEMLVNCPVSITWFMIILNERLMFHIVTSGYSVLFPLSHWLQSRSKQSHQPLYQWRRMKSICCDVLEFKGKIHFSKNSCDCFLLLKIWWAQKSCTVCVITLLALIFWDAINLYSFLNWNDFPLD